MPEERDGRAESAPVSLPPRRRYLGRGGNEQAKGTGIAKTVRRRVLDGLGAGKEAGTAGVGRAGCQR